MMSDRQATISVVPDVDYPGMWRVRRSDGQLSDMVNISRANELAEMLRKQKMKDDAT